MKNIIKIVLLFFLTLTIFSCNETIEDAIEETNEYKRLTQKIFSVEDFVFYSKKENSVIHKLSKEAIMDFKDNLKFGKNGELATARYIIIEKELSKEELDEFWSLFGFRGDAELTDHKGYKCVSPHNCKIQQGYICMTGC